MVRQLFRVEKLVAFEREDELKSTPTGAAGAKSEPPLSSSNMGSSMSESMVTW